MTTEARRFADWMVKVDRTLVSECGLTSEDLADPSTLPGHTGYHDMYENEYSPEDAAATVLEANGFPD
jgi:hypothetical protein